VTGPEPTSKTSWMARAGNGKCESHRDNTVFTSIFFYIRNKIGYQIEKYSIFFRGGLGKKWRRQQKKETVFVTSLRQRAEIKLEERVTDRLDHLDSRLLHRIAQDRTINFIDCALQIHYWRNGDVELRPQPAAGRFFVPSAICNPDFTTARQNQCGGP